MQGSNQEWYSFKERFSNHVNCSTTCNGGQFYMKSLQHKLKENDIE